MAWLTCSLGPRARALSQRSSQERRPLVDDRQEMVDALLSIPDRRRNASIPVICAALLCCGCRRRRRHNPRPPRPTVVLVSIAELAAAAEGPFGRRASRRRSRIGVRRGPHPRRALPPLRRLRRRWRPSLGSELPSVETAKRVFEAAGVSDDSRVVVYAPSPVTAARAFFTLDAFGHQQRGDARRRASRLARREASDRDRAAAVPNAGATSRRA